MPANLSDLQQVAASVAGNPPEHNMQSDIPSPPTTERDDSSSKGGLRGINALRDFDINCGLATPIKERERYGLTGLLPPTTCPHEVEVQRAAAAVARVEGHPLLQYQLLMALHETHKSVFFSLMQQDVERYLPLAYTPTVGDACKAWSSLVPRPTGLYMALGDKGRVREVLGNWPSDEVKIAVITDGERILGLGDLGVNGAGIPVGKSAVYGAAGVNPDWLLPITLDVGCDTKGVVDDPLYVGTRQPRERGDPYYALVDEVVAALQERYGKRVLVHWEDVGSEHAQPLLDRLEAASVPSFDDDIQATSAITLAALLGATRMSGVPPLEEQTFLFFGAGEANLGCAALVCAALRAKGLKPEDAKRRVFMMDSHGLILEGREGVSESKKLFAQPASAVPEGTDKKDLAAVVRAVKPTALIGAAAQGGAFSKQVLEALAEVAPSPSSRPAILPLSNPDSKAECTYAQALEATGGRAVFASGTQFPTAKGKDGKLLAPAQANNCFIFPGLGLGAVVSGAKKVTEGMLLAAAHAVADLLQDEELAQECVLPKMKRLRQATLDVAAAVAIAAAQEKVCTATPDSSPVGAALARVGEDGAKPGSDVHKEVVRCIGELTYTAPAAAPPKGAPDAPTK